MIKLFRIVAILSLLLLIISLTITNSSDFNQDLGRHLKIGEIIVQTKSVQRTNLFSFTNPNFPFINHHWLSEVIFYLIKTNFGLASLQYLKIFCICISILLATYTAYKKSGLIPALISCLIFMPLLIDRIHIRPELFGYVFFSFLLFIYFSYPKYKKLIYSIPIVLLLWINTHITFIFGIILTVFIFKKIYFRHKKFTIHNSEFLILLVSIFILIINPNGINGVLYPFRIFQNYGYQIAENQNLFFLSGMMFFPVIKYFFLMTPVVLFTIIILLEQHKFNRLLLFFLFYFFAFYQIRHFPFFVLIAVPIVASIIQRGIFYIKIIIKKKNVNNSTYLIFKYSFLITLIIFCSIGTYIITQNIYYNSIDSGSNFGISFTEDGEKASDFVLQKKLPKNIFNNFDIGGYLIYRLYPNYKVFVDNRPEAYPKEFFESLYVPLHIDKEFRQKIFEKYKIHSVIYSHTDQTQWARTFLDQILKDPAWKLIYLDDTIIILSDTSDIPDIRSSQKYFSQLINSESNYYNLLKLSNILQILNKDQFAILAFEKAKELNPNSCSIIRSIYGKNSASPLLLYQAEELKKKSWWCF